MKQYNTSEEQTKVFDKHGTFFAFSKDQLDRQKKEGVEYESWPGGMICPAGEGVKVISALENIDRERVAYELANNSIKDLVWYALANYECQITSDYSDAVESVASYGITEQQVSEEWPGYFQHCVDNDYF